MQRLDVKQPSVRYIQEVSFKPLLALGESVSYANVDRRLLPQPVRKDAEFPNVDDSSTVTGTVLASADTARIEVLRGTHNQKYALRTLVSTSGGNTWEEDLVLPVWDYNKG